MEQINITFVSVEGECRRLIGLVEQKGGPVRSINMTEEPDGALSRLLVKYSNPDGEQRTAALINRIRGIHGVVDVTPNDCG